ncbi:Fluoroacetate dehalogenase [Fusarium oxysporum f. sp. albedinis]|nr:Fluoroacetate dehalogenase [Fusarium oxysporum f. sp. albedinis]
MGIGRNHRTTSISETTDQSTATEKSSWPLVASFLHRDVFLRPGRLEMRLLEMGQVSRAVPQRSIFRGWTSNISETCAVKPTLRLKSGNTFELQLSIGRSATCPRASFH